VVRRGGALLDVSVRVRNLLDERYSEIYNFPSAGRVFQLGARAALGL
jgi:outer membrane cobalamin receptor